MKTVVGGILAALVLATAAYGDDAQSVMKNYFGNTLSFTYQGDQYKFFYNPDGTYQQTNSKGTMSGTWTYADGQVCHFAKNAKGEDIKRCHPMDAHSVGDSWQQQEQEGVRTFTLTAGRG